jgi:co-chaperonin GroES (HSP10)
MFGKATIAIALGTALLVPQVAGARAAHGVVVKRDAAHHKVVVASAGTLRTLTVKKAYRTGTVVRVSGTNVRAIGRTHAARIRGLVMAQSAGRFSLSANGQVVTIASRHRHQAGDAIAVDVSVGATTLTETGSDDAAEVEDGELNGTVSAAAAGKLTLTMGVAPTTTAIDIAYDPTLDLSGFVGKVVEVSVSVAGDAYGAPVYTLLKIEAEDQASCGSDGQGEGDGEDGNGGNGHGEDIAAKHRDGGSNGGSNGGSDDQDDDNSTSNSCAGS